MTTATRQPAGTASFAHLITPTRAASARPAAESDDERKQREDDEREKNKKATGKTETDDEREGREDDEREKNKKATGKAETDDERRDREDDEDDSGKGRRAKGEDDDDGDERPNENDEDDDEEMSRARGARFGKALRAARRLERRRINNILSSPAAAGRVAQAANLACNTGMSSGQAVALLNTLPKDADAGAPKRSALDRAMERERYRPSTGPGGKVEPVSALAAAVAAETKRIEAHRNRRRG